MIDKVPVIMIDGDTARCAGG